MNGPVRHRRLRILLTCEHASNTVPLRYRPLFRGASRLLRSHRAWDPGALRVARMLSRRFGVAVHAGSVTRLLVDLNRTRDDRGRFSEFSLGLEPGERARILETYVKPHWSLVRQAIRDQLREGGSVLHVACHSFTPVLEGKTRPYEIGLLFDPHRQAEMWVAARWRKGMVSRSAACRVRHNLPYRGWTDGMTTAMRAEFGARYLGIELECNQRALKDSRRLRELATVAGAALEEIVDAGLPSDFEAWSGP